MSKADDIRKLLAEGMAVADVSRATGAHYSQVHGIAKKLKEVPVERTTKTAKPARVVRGSAGGSKPTVRRPAARRASAGDSGTPDPEASQWTVRPDDEDAGPCAVCEVPLVSRRVLYGGKDYGRQLIHSFASRGVTATPEQQAEIQRHAARAKANVETAAKRRLGERTVRVKKNV